MNEKGFFYAAWQRAWRAWCRVKVTAEPFPAKLQWINDLPAARRVADVQTEMARARGETFNVDPCGHRTPCRIPGCW